MKKGKIPAFIDHVIKILAGIGTIATILTFIFDIFDMELNSIGRWMRENSSIIFGLTGAIFIVLIMSLVVKHLRKSDVDAISDSSKEHDYLQLFEPVEYIEGTLVPKPRALEENETIEHYEVYLAAHYAQYGIEADRIKRPRGNYPHEIVCENGKRRYTDYYLKLTGRKNSELSEEDRDTYDNGLFTYYGYAKNNGNGNYDTLTYAEKRQVLSNYMAYLQHQANKKAELQDFVENIINGKYGIGQAVDLIDKFAEEEKIEAYFKNKQKVERK